MKEGPQKYTLKLSGASGPIQTYAKESFRIEYHKGEELGYQAWLAWNDELSLPVDKGDQVGELIVKNSYNEEVKRIPLYSRGGVGPSIKNRVLRFVHFEAPAYEYVIVFVLFLLLFFFRSAWLYKH